MVWNTRIVGLGVALACGGAFAAPVVVFSDNFDAENGGVGQLNYSNFANWTVSNGTVDLIGNGFFDFLPGNGLYVDLDGSSGDAGTLAKTAAITFELGKEYTLTFDLAGNHRFGGNESVTIEVGLGSLLTDVLVVGDMDPFTLHTYTIIGDGNSYSLSFENLGGDNVGALLDDVLLTVVPLPSASAMAGLALVGLTARRTRKSV